MKSIKVFSGGLAGLKTGASTAVLFAPVNGSTTRKQLEKK